MPDTGDKLPASQPGWIIWGRVLGRLLAGGAKFCRYGTKYSSERDKGLGGEESVI